jgi:hypothetical protein
MAVELCDDWDCKPRLPLDERGLEIRVLSVDPSLFFINSEMDYESLPRVSCDVSSSRSSKDS